MFSHLSGDPLSVVSVTWIGAGGAQYLLLLALPCIALWRRALSTVLLIGLPLVLVNLPVGIGSAELIRLPQSRTTLVHHYSLPLAGGDRGRHRWPAANIAHAQRRGPPKAVIWASACWLALAKPWFFTGPYLQRRCPN